MLAGVPGFETYSGTQHNGTVLSMTNTMGEKDAWTLHTAIAEEDRGIYPMCTPSPRATLATRKTPRPTTGPAVLHRLGFHDQVREGGMLRTHQGRAVAHTRLRVRVARTVTRKTHGNAQQHVFRALSKW